MSIAENIAAIRARMEEAALRCGRDPREILLFFYYPSDEFISWLMTVDELDFFDEIDCGDLFSGQDPRERILIFSLPDYES